MSGEGFAELIRRERVKRGMSQRMLSVAAGVCKGRIEAIEANRFDGMAIGAVDTILRKLGYSIVAMSDDELANVKKMNISSSSTTVQPHETGSMDSSRQKMGLG